MTRGNRRMQLAVGVGLLAALVLGVALGARSPAGDDSASPAALDRIAAKNEEAANVAAARMKAESEASAAAADARQRAVAAVSEPDRHGSDSESAR